MKKMLFRCFCMLFVAAFLMSLVPTALAMEWELEVGGNYEERFYDYQSKVWNFTPKETGEYLLYTADSLMGEIVGQTQASGAGLQPGFQVYKLTAGNTYQIKIQLKETYSAPYSDIFRLEKKEPLQSLTLNCTEYTGQRDGYDSFNAEWYPSYYSMEGLSWTSSDSSIVSIEDVYDFSCFFRMNKVGSAVLTAKMGNLSASCNITVEKATGYWDDYPVWPAGQREMQCSVTGNQGTAYSYTPSQSGVYALHASGELHADIHGTSPSHILNDRNVSTINGDYHLVDLIAGETYVVGIATGYMGGGDTLKTGTVSIEKASAASSITLYGPNMIKLPEINGYVGGMQDVFPVTDPVYAFGLTGGYTYSVSNPSMVDLEQTKTDGTNHLFLLEGGSCTLTVVTGNTKVVYPVMVKPSPVLTVGKTTTLQFSAGDAYGVTCLFTPSESGYYTFTIRGSGGTCYIEDTQIGNFIYGSGAMGGWLQGGRTYKVILGVGDSNHTVTVSGSGNVPPQDLPEPPKGDEPQEPDEPADPIVPDEPTDPIVPSEPTDPIVPSEPTEPTDPQKPSVPTEPIDPPEPSAPTEPVDPPKPSLPTEPVTPSFKPEAEELAEQLGGSYENGAIQLDAQSGNVNISAQDLSLLAQMNVNLVVEGEDFTVKLDSTALNAVAGKSAGDMVLRIRKPDKEMLREEQKTALKDKNVAGVITIDLTCNGSEIHDFGGGQAMVTIPFAAEDPNADYAVYYVSPEGSLEKMENVTCADGSLTFRTGHFSDYVIVEETIEEKEKQPNLLLPILLGVAAVVAAVVVVFLRRKK